MKYKRRRTFNDNAINSNADHRRFHAILSDWKDNASLTEDWTGSLEEMPQMIDSRRESIYIKNLNLLEL